jgi:phage/plasmid-associated DNA primase
MLEVSMTGQTGLQQDTGSIGNEAICLRINHLDEKLPAGKPGILNWLIKRGLHWRRDGLKTLIVILQAL